MGIITGYALGSRITKNLVIGSLLMAVTIIKLGLDFIHHAGRRSQYGTFPGVPETACALQYGELLWNNKNELVYHQRYTTREQAIGEIAEYFANRPLIAGVSLYVFWSTMRV